MEQKTKYLNVIKNCVDTNKQLKIDKTIFELALKEEQTYIRKINDAFVKERQEKEQAMKQLHDYQQEMTKDDAELEQLLKNFGSELTPNDKKKLEGEYKNLLSARII